MEKYSGFTDIGTGIQPFLYPVKTIETPSWLIPFKAILFLVRAILLTIVALLVLITNYVSELLIWRPLIWSWNRILNFFLLRLALFICGFHWIQTSEISLKKTRKEVANGSAKSFIPERRATLLISNHSSYFDIIYLAFRYNPQFLRVDLHGQVEAQTFLQALYECGNPIAEKLENGVPLQTFLKSYRSFYCPLAIMPEGTTSNGRGLLRFVPIFDDNELGERLELIGFKYSWEQSVCPSFTTGTKLSHLMNMLSYLNHNLQVRRLAQKDIIFTSESVAMKNRSITNDSTEGIYGSQISNLLAATLRLRKISKTAQDKSEFLQYYNERESKLSRQK